MQICIELGQRSDTRPAFTPERALELKAKARELFVQGLEYTSALEESRHLGPLRGKPVWE